MSIDRELVQKFLREVDSQIVPSISSGAARLQGHQKLLSKYQSACTAWNNRKVQHVKDIASTVNELCIARLILNDKKVTAASYEPQLEGTGQSIDFLVFPAGSEARIFYDVKTVQPEERDAWDRYKRAQSMSRFALHTELCLEQKAMGGEIAHELFASREKFLEYTIELEAKIRSFPKKALTYFRLIFCGNGHQWRRDQLEDFADFYFSGHCRADDALGPMQTHYMVEKGITLDRSIHGFCYFARKSPDTIVDAFQCTIRGPRFPWEVSHEG